MRVDAKGIRGRGVTGTAAGEWQKSSARVSLIEKRERERKWTNKNDTNERQGTNTT